MKDMMMKEGYIRSLQFHEFREENSIRRKNVGSWIVSLQKHSRGAAIYIYSATTLQEHYKTETIGLNCSETASDDVKEFYKRVLERDFAKVVEIAKSWN